MSCFANVHDRVHTLIHAHVRVGTMCKKANRLVRTGKLQQLRSKLFCDAWADDERLNDKLNPLIVQTLFITVFISRSLGYFMNHAVTRSSCLRAWRSSRFIDYYSGFALVDLLSPIKTAFNHSCTRSLSRCTTLVLQIKVARRSTWYAMKAYPVCWDQWATLIILISTCTVLERPLDVSDTKGTARHVL